MPKSLKSYAATQAFADNYPYASSYAPIFIVASAKIGTSIINDATKALSQKLGYFAGNHSDVISTVIGYWEVIHSDTPSLAFNYVSPDYRTMESVVVIKYNAKSESVDKLVISIISFCSSNNNRDIDVYCSGSGPLFKEMQDATTENFATIDEIVLPIALIILGYCVQSYRHIGIALLNLVCTILLAFAILVPVTYSFDVNPFAPSIMLSLGIAISFDYSLFLISRFRGFIIIYFSIFKIDKCIITRVLN